MPKIDDETSWLGLAGKVCVVTGAASGIGAAIARQLAGQGAKLALFDKNLEGVRSVAAELAGAGATVLAFGCDTSLEAEVKAAAQQVLEHLGPSYGLVNNAGFLRAGRLAEVSLEDWNAVLGVNLTGYLLCARAFACQMRATGGGSIVHSKFYEEPGFEAKRAASTASKRIGEPADIADAALFLLSPRASYVNGAELAVDGAMSAMLMDSVPRPGFNEIGKS